MKPEGRRKRRERLCARCGQRRAKFRRRDGSMGKDPQHNLCTRCYRELRDRMAARKLAYG